MNCTNQIKNGVATLIWEQRHLIWECTTATSKINRKASSRI
ncbi:MAG: hypothetical protein AAFR83_24040 [Cyanobacteria bacterium J06629_18]